MKQMSEHYLKKLDFAALRNCKSWRLNCPCGAQWNTEGNACSLPLLVGVFWGELRL